MAEGGFANSRNAEVFTTSRWKTGLFLLLALGFVAIGVMMVRDPDGHDALAGWFVLIVFGLGGLVFGWRIIHPQVLALDDEGFVVSGGMVRRPRKELWRTIDRFVLYRAGRSARLIGYIYVAGARPESRLIAFNRRFGAEAGIAGSWPLSNARMVDLLNERLRRARQGAD